MNTKPPFNSVTTATRKNSKPVAPLIISDLDRQARAETYLEMATWVSALPATKSAREKRHRELLLNCIQCELEDLGYSLEEVSK
jgi:hypothetical protein